MSIWSFEMELVGSWEQLDQDLLSEHHEEIELNDYLLKLPYPSLPLSDYGAYQSFIESWQDIGFERPESRRNIETVFLIEWTPAIGGYDRRPLELAQNALGHPGILALANCALSPASVREIAKLTKDFDLDTYMPYFEPPEQGYFQRADDFRHYSQIWLDNFNLAAATNSGLLLIAR